MENKMSAALRAAAPLLIAVGIAINAMGLVFVLLGGCAGAPTPAAVASAEGAADVACQIFLLVDPGAPDLAREGCLTIEDLDKLKQRKGALAPKPMVKAACPPPGPAK
jgi:hypothetical protein